MIRHVLTLLPLLMLATCAVAADEKPRMELGTNFWNLGWHKPSDCFKDVKQVQGDSPWNEQFLKEIAVFRCFRFMDWDNTNGSTRAQWSQRPPKDAAKQNPVAYEWMIDLCNRMNADMWVTVPHPTITRTGGDQPSDYSLRLCILVKTGVDMKQADLRPLLDKLATLTEADLLKAGGVKTCEPLKPALKLYVEYSNETWNGMFKQAHYCCDEGEALGLDAKNRWAAGFRYHAWAAIRLFRAADLVFGADSKRVIRVLATQSGNSWIAGQHLGVMNDPRLNPWKIKADAIATAPYFGHDAQGTAPDAVAQLRERIRKSGEQSAKHRQIADAAGMKLIAYEGGQHVTRDAQGINRDPAMHAIYTEYLTEMNKHYTLFVHYAHVGQAGKGGAWGAIEFTGQPLDQAHKYRALAEWGSKSAK